MKATEQTKPTKLGAISGGMVKNIDSTSVALAIVNVNNELQKLETKDKTKANYSGELLRKIKKIYDDLIKMLNRHPQFPSEVIEHQDLNLFYPLMKLISIKLSRGEDIVALTDTYGMLLWHHMNHPVLLKSFMRLFTSHDTIMKQFCKLILELAPKLQPVNFLYAYWYTRKVTDALSEDVKDEWHAISMGYVKFVTENVEECYQIILDLENMSTVSTFTKDNNKKLTDMLILLIEGLGLESKKELLALMFSTTRLAENLESLSELELSNVNKKSVSKVLEIIRNTLIWNDPCLTSTKKVISSLSKTNSISIKLNTKHSILFILEILDHGNDFNYLHSYNLLSYLTMSLRSLNNLFLCGKQNLYQQYNQLNSKISLTALLANLNYIISTSLLSIYTDNEEIPEIISTHFKRTRLPPLPKSDYFFDSFNTKDPFDNDLRLANNSGNIIRLMHCQSLNLHLLLQILQDELYAISMMNTYSAEQVNLKLIFRLIDLLFSSLFPSLVFLQKYDDQNKDTKAIRDIILDIYHKLISIDLRYTHNSLMWVCLINFASDICYFDLRFVPIFESLFKFLVDKTASNAIQDDELVKSALDFFFTTFSNQEITYQIRGADYKKEKSSSQSNSVTVEISYDEYKFMYPHRQHHSVNPDPITEELRMDSLTTNDPYVNVPHTYPNMQDHTESKKHYNNSNNNDLLFIFEPEIANASTPLKSNYVTNFARQQSIHVDQYGKL